MSVAGIRARPQVNVDGKDDPGIVVIKVSGAVTGHAPDSGEPATGDLSDA